MVYVKANQDNNYKKITNQYYINDTAYDILEHINGFNTLQSISDKLAKKYNDESYEVAHIVSDFIGILEKDYNIKIVKQSQPQEKSVKIVKNNNIYPITVSIELTNKCNLKCKHCYGSFQSKGIEMPLSNIKKLLYDLENLGVRNIEFSGGDISVYPYLYETLKTAYSLNFSAIILLTNGIFMDKEVKDIIAKNSERSTTTRTR